MKANNTLNKSNYLKGYNSFNKFISLLVVGLFITQIEGSFQLNLPIIRYLVYLLAFYYFIYSIYKGFSFRNFGGVFQKILLLVLFFSIGINLIKALPSLFLSADNYVNSKRALSGQVLLFLFPLILLTRPNLLVISKTIVLSYKLAVLFLVITIPLIVYYITNPLSGAEGMVRNVASGSMVLFLTLSYYPIKVKLVSIVTFILSFLLMFAHARRNMILYFTLMLLFLIAIVYLNPTLYAKRQRGAFSIGLFFVTAAIIYIVYSLNFDFSYTFERFATTAKDGINYSRETILEEFESDFNSKPIDWWFGRGLNGSFFSNQGGGVDNLGSYIEGQRQEIENGYYFLILKGGLLYVIPFVLLSLIGFTKGFFHSKNMLSKAAAAIVFINLIDLIGFGVPGLHLKYLILWLSLSICFSPIIRNYSDEQVRNIISIK